MSILQEILISIRHYGDALKLIRKHKMWPLLFVSFILFTLILLLCGFGIYQGYASLIDWVLNRSWVQAWHSFFENASWVITLFKVGVSIASFFLFMSFGKFVFLSLGSPLYAYISEKGAEKYKGVEYPFSLKQLIKDVVRGIRLAIRNFFKQLLLTIILFLLSFIPVFGLLFSLLIIMLDAYYYGFAMLDYCCERDKKNVRASLQFIKEHKGLALGNGLVFYASIVFIPIVGIVFIAPISAIAAMISYFHITEKS